MLPIAGSCKEKKNILNKINSSILLSVRSREKTLTRQRFVVIWKQGNRGQPGQNGLEGKQGYKGPQVNIITEKKYTTLMACVC